MPVVGVIAASDLTITSGTLGDTNQGQGSHLFNQTITLNSGNLIGVDMSDANGLFDDFNDQRLTSDVMMNNQTFTANSYVQAEYTLTLSDGSNTYTAVGVAFGGSFSNVQGLAFLGPVPPVGVALTVTGNSEGPRNDSNFDFASFAPCFTAGSMIDTPDGRVAIETLSAGDMVLTVDNGPQPVRWVGQRHLDADALAAQPALRPIRLEKAAFGAKGPDCDMLVSPQHRMLMTGPQAELLFGEEQVLVPAHALTNDKSVRQIAPDEGVTYVHIMFDSHQLVTVDGTVSESFYPDATALSAVGSAQREEIFTLFPELKLTEYGAPARQIVANAQATLRGR